MAYGKLCEGSRPETQVAATPMPSAWANEFQDQLKTMLGPRMYGLPVCGYVAATGSTWVLREDASPMFWEDITRTSAGYLLIPVVLPDGCKVTLIDVWVHGSAGQTGGIIKFMKQPCAAGAVSSTAAGIAPDANPWANAGITEISSGAIAVEITTDYSYWIEFRNATGAIADNRVYGAQITAQFGH
jgi:hypothetical protein